LFFNFLAILFSNYTYDRKINLNNILFLDIETVPEVEDYELDSEMKDLWEHKTNTSEKKNTLPKIFYSRAGIWAEFGKIACISVGYFVIKGDVRNFGLRLSLAKRKDFEGFQ
jgi:hypothetical protein